jgi:hypothetical protein
MSRTMDTTGSLAWVEEKIAAVTHIPVENGEPFNVLRYKALQHYDSHCRFGGCIPLSKLILQGRISRH